MSEAGRGHVTGVGGNRWGGRFEPHLFLFIHLVPTRKLQAGLARAPLTAVMVRLPLT